MGYFHKDQDVIDRGGKVVADILCALMILTFAITFFGAPGGLLAFVVLEGVLLAIDFFASENDDASGVAVR